MTTPIPRPPSVLRRKSTASGVPLISQQAATELWQCFRTEEADTISSQLLSGFLKRAGLDVERDPRLATLRDALLQDEKLGDEPFVKATADSIGLIKRAATNELRIPNFGSFVDVIKDVYEQVLPNRDGANAGYIPQLRDADPEKFAISVCTVDGQQFSIGDSDDQFCIQSCSKPLSYLLALQEFGEEYVHKSVGTEPSGRAFNEIVLKDISTKKGEKHSIPHNPMINAGAIMICSMVYPSYSRQERLEKVIKFWKCLSGGVEGCIGFSDETYKSESGTADQNWCLAYMMKEFNAFPECFNQQPDYKKALEDTLELYFSICSILNTCQGMAVMAATIANGGVNPLTSERIVDTLHVRQALPLMLSSGMYDYSGQWAFDVGVPAKSGVGGCVFLVIPNIGGISIFSPRLDPNGNSVRGVAVATELVKRIRLHNFETFSGLHIDKIDLSHPKYADTANEMSAMAFAATQGDLVSVVQAHNSGSNLCMQDYDGRTPLHLAATEGHVEIVRFLAKKYSIEKLMLMDRWSNTALDDAMNNLHTECASILRDAGCKEEECSNQIHKEEFEDDNDELVGSFSLEGQQVRFSEFAPRLLVAAAAGDLDEVIKLHCSGVVPLTAADYDKRTALHLAACEGHLHILRYLIVNFDGDDVASYIRAHDRWLNGAIDDAESYGQKHCAEYLRGIMGGDKKN